MIVIGRFQDSIVELTKRNLKFKMRKDCIEVMIEVRKRRRCWSHEENDWRSKRYLTWWCTIAWSYKQRSRIEHRLSEKTKRRKLTSFTITFQISGHSESSCYQDREQWKEDNDDKRKTCWAWKRFRVISERIGRCYERRFKCW